jgi:diphthamide synthase (EF-2-diphthine--ammonia ligase)
MTGACRDALAQGISAVAFGDLFLEDIRAYRERQLQGTGLEPLFPLWQIPTGQLARDMVRGGLRAKLVCVDPKKLPPEFVGREFDSSLTSDLPPGVDPCGENGEFHTCVYAGPMFSQAIPIVTGERVLRDGFWFCDVLPATTAATAS